jgi:hypothetical protein
MLPCLVSGEEFLLVVEEEEVVVAVVVVVFQWPQGVVMEVVAEDEHLSETAAVAELIWPDTGSY